MIAIQLRPPGHAGSTYEFISKDHNALNVLKTQYPGNIRGCAIHIVENPTILLFGDTDNPWAIGKVFVEHYSYPDEKETYYGIEHTAIENCYEMAHFYNSNIFEVFKEFSGKKFIIAQDIDWKRSSLEYVGGQPYGAY
jgi:hypothetical protein